jgi:hypothetical protein
MGSPKRREVVVGNLELGIQQRAVYIGGEKTDRALE